MRAKSWVPDEEPELPDMPIDPFEAAARAFEQISIPIKEFYDDPAGFVDEFIDFGEPAAGTTLGLTAYQRQVMQDVPTAMRVAVRGPHGLGKTTMNALLVIWFAITREDAKVDWKCVTTAGAWRQLEKYLWPEIRKWAKRLRWDKLGIAPWREGRESMTLSLNLEYGEAFAAASSDKEKIEGAHADEIMYVFDESKAIKSDIFDAAEGAFSGSVGPSGDGTPTDTGVRSLRAFAVATSTPGDTQGRFYDIHLRKPGFEDWTTRHVTVQEVMAAGRISEDWRAARERQWGADSALYHNRVLGEFYSTATDTTIPLAWVELAVERWHTWRDSGRRKHAPYKVLGVDVARGGRDFTVISHRRGWVVEQLEKLNVATTTRVTEEVQVRLGMGDSSIIDVVGVGGGVYDQLVKLGVNARPFTASGKSHKRDLSGQMGFLNRRAEMWWNMRQLLDPDNGQPICLPPDGDLIAELVCPKWSVTAGNRIQVESKDELRKRLGRSTDVADGVLQSFVSPDSLDEGADVVSAPLVAQRYAGPQDLDAFRPGGGHTADGSLAWGSGNAESFYEWEREF